MKAMLALDFAVIKKQLVQSLIMCVFLGFFIAVMTEEALAIPPAICATLSITVTFSLVALDERGGWERLRLTMPLSRAAIMRGRFASVAAIIAMAFLAGIAITGIAVALSPTLTSFFGVDMLDGFSGTIFAFSAALGLAIPIVLASVVLPLVAKFGMTKAILWIPMAFAVIFLAVFAYGSGNPTFGADIATAVSTALDSAGGTATMIAATLAVCVVLYVASCALSCKLYEAREL